MLNRITWKFWAALGVFAAFYVAMFPVLGHSGRFDSDFYSTGLAVAFVMPWLFVGGYTLLGKKWWRNDFGTNLVLLSLASEPENFGLGWTFIFNHGQLTTALLAWITIGGPWWTALVLAWRFGMLLRVNREEKNGKAHEEAKEPVGS